MIHYTIHTIYQYIVVNANFYNGFGLLLEFCMFWVLGSFPRLAALAYIESGYGGVASSVLLQLEQFALLVSYRRDMITYCVGSKLPHV